MKKSKNKIIKEIRLVLWEDGTIARITTKQEPTMQNPRPIAVKSFKIEFIEGEGL